MQKLKSASWLSKERRAVLPAGHYCPLTHSYLRIIEVAQVGAGVHLRSHQGGDQGDRHGGGRLLRTLRFRGEPAPSTLQTVRPHHLLHHPHHQTLLEPTELATVSSPLVHRAVFVRQANVLGVFLHRPFEEAFAAFAGTHAVVLTGRVVSADSA